MPEISALALEYKDKVTILGIDIRETKTTSIEKVKAFVHSMGSRMDYHVAAEDSNFMVTSWFDASGEQSIPKSFVVNAEGRLAWIGHPKDLREVLPKIVNNTWDLKEALAKRNLDNHIDQMDHEASYKLNNYVGDAYKQDYLGRPDSALLLIDEIVRNEPTLKYAPLIAFHTFSALLKTNPHKAYEYGNELLTKSANEDAPYSIIDAVKWYSDKLNLPAEIYGLSADAYQAYIDQIPYPEIVNMAKYYKNMAEWYWRANDKLKAIKAQQKAIEALKSKKGFSVTETTEFESRLQEYIKM